MNKLLSIVITCYNKEKYISYPISLLKEQVTSNVEVIIIDDGSTDKSPEIIKELCEGTNFKLVFNKENMGTGTTKDIGLSMLSGRYFVYIDGDDMIPDDYIETLLKYAMEAEHDIYRFKMRLYPEGEIMDDTFSLCDKLYRTEKVRDLKLDIDRSLRTMEDFKFYHELIDKGADEIMIDKIIYTYNHLPEHTVTHEKSVWYGVKDWD